MSEQEMSDLRQKAEEKLAERDTRIRSLERTDLEKLAHELAVHQVELEIQNEELRLSRLEAERARDRYLDLFDFAPVGYFTLDEHNRIVEANLAGCELLNIDKNKLLKQSFTRFIRSEESDRFYLQRRKVLKSGSRQTGELQMEKADGAPFFAQIESLKVCEERLRLAVMDITEQKKIEEALARAKDELETRVEERTADLSHANRQLEETIEFNQTLLEHSPTGIQVYNADCSIRYSNPQAEKMTGYTHQEAVNLKPPFPWWPQDKISEYTEVLDKACKGETTKGERILRNKQGDYFWVEVIQVPIKVGSEVSYLLSSWVDITEQKKLREEREQFTRRLVNAQEEERKRISRDLHDEIAQRLALATLELDALSNKERHFSEDNANRLVRVKETVDLALQEVRRFSHELRPSVLEHLGLVEAIDLITEESNVRWQTGISFKVSGSETPLPEDIALALFRITQEALNNVRKHAQATKVKVNIRYWDSKVRLSVSDNGKGFNPKEKKGYSFKGSLGLLSMRERAHLVHGTLQIRSRIGLGTTVSVEVPYSLPES